MDPLAPAAGAGLELDARRCHHNSGLLGLALFLLQKVEVHSCMELREALANPAVEHVLLMPRPSGDVWNCTAADFPPFSVDISGRDVLMEGYGDKQLYYDVSMGLGSAKAAGGCLRTAHAWQRAREKASFYRSVPAVRCTALWPTPRPPQANKVNNQIIVHEGASLTVANLWADNCVQAQSVPFTCLATTKGAYPGAGLLRYHALVVVQYANSLHAVCRELPYLRLSIETPTVPLTPLPQTRRRLADVPRQPDKRRQLPAHQAVRTGQLGSTGVWFPDGPKPGAV